MTKAVKLTKTEAKMFEDIKKATASEKGIFVPYGCYGKSLGSKALSGLEAKNLIKVRSTRAGLRDAYVELVSA